MSLSHLGLNADPRSLHVYFCTSVHVDVLVHCKLSKPGIGLLTNHERHAVGPVDSVAEILRPDTSIVAVIFVLACLCRRRLSCHQSQAER